VYQAKPYIAWIYFYPVGGRLLRHAATGLRGYVQGRRPHRAFLATIAELLWLLKGYVAQLSQYGVKYGLKTLIYSIVNGAFSPILPWLHFL
jgi:hypothetical protein